MPTGRRGNKACMAFLSKNIKYPPVCVSEEASGRVYMQFVVEKDGEICQIRVLFSLLVKFGLK